MFRLLKLVCKEKFLCFQTPEVQLAALQLAISHGSQPQTGLSDLLHDLLKPGRLRKLQGIHREMLMLQLPTALAALSPQGQTLAIENLATLAGEEGEPPCGWTGQLNLRAFLQDLANNLWG